MFFSHSVLHFSQNVTNFPKGINKVSINIIINSTVCVLSTCTWVGSWNNIEVAMEDAVVLQQFLLLII